MLNKAATLAAKKHVLLADSQLPPALVNAKTKPLSQELTKLTKRIRQFPGGCRCGCPWWTTGRGRGRRGFGDGSRGTMVEAHDKRQSVHPQTTHYTPSGLVKKGKAASTSQIPIKKGSPSTSRGDSDIRTSFRSHSRTAQDPGKKLAESSWGKGKGKGKGKGLLEK